MAVCVWRVTGPVFILETPWARAMKMISCGEGGEKEHLTQGLVLGVNVLSLPTEKHQKPPEAAERTPVSSGFQKP